MTDNEKWLIDQVITDLERSLLYLRNDIREYRNGGCTPGELLDTINRESKNMQDQFESCVNAVNKASSIGTINGPFWCDECGNPLKFEEMGKQGLCAKCEEGSR